MKIGAKIAHLGMTPGMMMSSSAVTSTNPTISGIGAETRRLERVGEVDREHRRDVRVIEEGDELGDDQEQEDQPGQPGVGLHDAR